MKLALIIPAYNEENTIAETVKNVLPYGTVIVANDGSKDQTAERAGMAGAIVLTPPRNLGYDGAVNLGFQKALEINATHVLTFDADGQHPFEQIPEFIDKLLMNYSVVVGVRKQMPRFSEAIFQFYFQYKFQISDPLTGMKAYNLEPFKKIGHFDSVSSIGTELLARYLLMHLPVAQVPILIKDRQDSSRFGGTWSANKKILLALWRLNRLICRLQQSAA